MADFDLKQIFKAPRQRLMDSTGLKTAVFFATLAALGAWIAASDLEPDLEHLQVSFLSGSERGNYHAIVRELEAEAAARQGRIANVVTAGSVDNVNRLAAARDACEAHYALVQDGMDWPEGSDLRLVGRLRKAETLFLLGKAGDKVQTFADLRGLRIGVGPEGSGTARIARQILGTRDFEPLAMTLSVHPLDEQLALLESGGLDLGAFVMDEDARFIEDAVIGRGLQIASLAHADVIARRLPFTRVGRIAAGQYDPVRIVPAEDKKVLRVDTLVVGNGCATRSQTMGLLTLLASVFPDFIRHNRDTPNATGLPLAPAARTFFESEGPELLGEYFPGLADVMPPQNWVHIVFAVSILFNVMSFWHRFRLWRVDANRVKAELYVPLLFGGNLSPAEIAATLPTDRHRTPEARHQLDTLAASLATLLARCRRHSLSVLVPMGQEMGYRYQEVLIADLLAAVRTFRERAAAPAAGVRASEVA